LPREAIDLTEERDRRRVVDPQDPEIPRLNQLITDTILSEHKKKWSETIENSKPNSNPDKFWRLTRILSGKRPHQPPNQPIYFGNKCFSKPQAIARRFCRQFKSVGVHKTSSNSRCVLKQLKKKHSLDKTFTPFTDALTKQAILKSFNSTALGLDGLTSIHLKFLGPLAITYLSNLFNLSLTLADILAVWKKAHIVPIPKPGKPANLSTGYRPISLLSPAVKVLERLLLPYITESLPCAPTQHGYRPLHSTVTALLPIATKVAIGFNQNRTVMVSLDISKAFDLVDHDLLLEKISNTDLQPNVTRWLAAYLRGCTAVCLRALTSSLQLLLLRLSFTCTA
jgi:hypothetical protein